ncbi:MAG: tetratricopeptide repeat protein, partial [Armatimonadetes bacterium]|nr:tetratricopeptide repeat protein [Armatimonadota bacterium]
AMNGLAQWHIKRGEFRQGREWAEKALKIDPQSEDALWWKAVASYWDEGRGARDASVREGEAHAEPIEFLWALTRSNVYAAASLALLGEFALRRNDYRSALDFFARALERNSQDSKALALAAFAARKLGDFDLAKQFLQRCEKVNPLEPLLWSERYLLRDEGRGTRDEEKALKQIFVDDALWLDVACDYEQVGAWGTASVWLAVAKRHLES